MKLPLTALTAALALTACTETHMVGASPEGGFITNTGRGGEGVFVKRGYLAESQANAHCDMFGKKAVFLDKPYAARVQFKCVPKDE
jgi:hypothetical protein